MVTVSEVGAHAVERLADDRRAELLDRLRAFAQAQDESVAVSDGGSLDRAADLIALYEDRSWRDELPAPVQKRKRGRPVDLDSFNRFTKWATEKTGLEVAHLKRLRKAHELARIMDPAGAINAGEWTLRPLAWLVSNDYADRVGDVWKAACADVLDFPAPGRRGGAA